MSLKLYKSYHFVDKDPVIDRMRGMMKGQKYSAVSAKSGVSHTTLHNWFEGKTKRPQYATVIAVMRALGYRETFTATGANSGKNTSSKARTGVSGSDLQRHGGNAK